MRPPKEKLLLVGPSSKIEGYGADYFEEKKKEGKKTKEKKRDSVYTADNRIRMCNYCTGTGIIMEIINNFMTLIL